MLSKLSSLSTREGGILVKVTQQPLTAPCVPEVARIPHNGLVPVSDLAKIPKPPRKMSGRDPWPFVNYRVNRHLACWDAGATYGVFALEIRHKRERAAHHPPPAEAPSAIREGALLANLEGLAEVGVVHLLGVPSWTTSSRHF